jgi:hypothetical protein
MTTLSPLLVDAKREYTVQLADLLTPYVMNTIARIFENAKQRTKEFRELLRAVPNWNATSIDERTNEIERRNPQLQDLIAACCVSYTKVLGSIRLNQSQSSNVRVSLPKSSDFVHSVYVYVAKEFFYEPKLVFADRHAKTALMRDAVEESVRQHVPMQQLLKAYLSVAVDTEGMDPMGAAADGFSTPLPPPRAMPSPAPPSPPSPPPPVVYSPAAAPVVYPQPVQMMATQPQIEHFMEQHQQPQMLQQELEHFMEQHQQPQPLMPDAPAPDQVPQHQMPPQAPPPPQQQPPQPEFFNDDNMDDFN